MKYNIVIPLCFSLLFTACSVKEAQVADLKNVDYGKYPNDYKKSIQEFYETDKSRPSSVEVQILSRPEKAYLRSIPVLGGDPVDFGYTVKACGSLKTNGKVYWKECHNFFLKNSNATVIKPNVWFNETWYRPVR